MALVLVRLRLIMASRNRGKSTGANAYYVTSWVVGVLFGLLAAFAAAAFATESSLGDALLLGGFVALSFPWLMGPILEPTLADGTVDPLRLEQFPLTTRQQVIGLLVGALIAPTATFTLLFSAGAAAAIGMSGAARLAALAIALSYTVMCVAVSRAAQALLAESLRSRRGRDFAALLAALMVLGLYAVTSHAQGAIESINSQLSGPLGVVASWLPPGAAAHGIIDARNGDWLDFGARIAVVVATIAVALLAWAWALGRRSRGDASSRGGGYRRSAADPLPLIPAAMSPLAATSVSAAAAQQWRYFFFRSPKAIQTLIIPPVMGVMVAHSSFAGAGPAAQSAAFAALAVVVGSFNVFGYDGPGFRYLLMSGASMSKVLLGKAVAPLLYLLPLLIVFTSVEALLQQKSSEIPIAAAAGLSVIVVGIGIGALSSVFNPSDQSRIGQHQGQFLKVFAWFIGFFAVVAVGASVWILLAEQVGHPLTALVMLVGSILAAVLLIGTAGRRLDRDPSGMLAQLAPADH